MKQYKHTEPVWEGQITTVTVALRPDNLVEVKLDNGFFMTLDANDCAQLAAKITQVAAELTSPPTTAYTVA